MFLLTVILLTSLDTNVLVDAQSTNCPNCKYYALFINGDGTEIQRGRETIEELDTIYNVFVSLKFETTTGEEACSNYNNIACGDNAICTAGPTDAIYYTCDCVEGNYCEKRKEQFFTCTEGPITTTVSGTISTATNTTTTDILSTTLIAEATPSTSTTTVASITQTSTTASTSILTSSTSFTTSASTSSDTTTTQDSTTPTKLISTTSLVTLSTTATSPTNNSLTTPTATLEASTSSTTRRTPTSKSTRLIANAYSTILALLSLFYLVS